LAVEPRDELTAAYSASAEAWRAGPDRVYGAVAEAIVDTCPIPLAAARVLDLGAGTGAVSLAVRRRGAGSIVALDRAPGMLRLGRDERPPAVVGEALELPFRDRAFDLVVASFSLNHLTDPVPALREADRVTRPGGAVMVTAYGADDAHPVREAVDLAAAALGWISPPWYRWLRQEAIPRLADEEAARRACEAAGLRRADVDRRQVRVPDLETIDLVRWRCGMAHLAPFVEQLPPAGRAELERSALAAIGPGCPPLVRSAIVITART
jgi:ubiquinone/menaquinone biosynthesis C-methylase UbiE